MKTNQIVRSHLLIAAFALAACGPKRGDVIDVDAVQGRANEVESNLRKLREAMREGDPKSAREAYEAAREALEDSRQALEAYPELPDLVQAVEEAGPEVCIFAVKTALERLFKCYREKDLEGSRDHLKTAREERDRCLKVLEAREEYTALRMSLESAPQALAELEVELARPALLKRMKSTQAELSEARTAIATKLSALLKKPNQRDLAVDIDREIKDLRERLGESHDFSAEPDWVSFAAKLSGEIEEFDRSRARLVRRGKLHAAVEERLREASHFVIRAVRVKPTERRSLLEQAVQLFRECRIAFAEQVLEEPGILAYELVFEGKRRSVRLLQKQIETRLAEAERLARRAGARLPPRPPMPKPTKKPPLRVQRW